MWQTNSECRSCLVAVIVPARVVCDRCSWLDARVITERVSSLDRLCSPSKAYRYAQAISASVVHLGVSRPNLSGKNRAKSAKTTHSRIRATCSVAPPLHHQQHPCRGSSIGRACGSYNSKEINLKVVGSSPTFGYSYHKLIRAAVLFCSLSPSSD